MSKKRRNHSPEFKSKVTLAAQGYEAGRKHVQRLMRRMGMQAIHPGPKTSKPSPQRKLYSLSVARSEDQPSQSGLGE